MNAEGSSGEGWIFYMRQTWKCVNSEFGGDTRCVGVVVNVTSQKKGNVA